MASTLKTIFSGPPSPPKPERSFAGAERKASSRQQSQRRALRQRRAAAAQGGRRLLLFQDVTGAGDETGRKTKLGE